MHGSNDILMTYLRVSQHMSRLFRCHFGRLQLTCPQALVLNVLGVEGPMPISTLAERTGSANSTVSGIVDRLEKLELARRDRSGTDRRIIYVAVTDKYQTLRAKGVYFASVLSTMSPTDRHLVAQSLLRLDEALLAKERADGLCPEPEEGGNRGLK